MGLMGRGDLLGSLGMDNILGNITEETDDIVLSVNVNANDIIDGVNKKVKYKRYINKKLVKERMVLTTEPFEYKTKFIFEGKGDDDGDLVVNLVINDTNTLHIDSSGDIHVKSYFDDIELCDDEIKLTDKFKTIVTKNEISSISYKVNNVDMSLNLGDGKKGNVYIQRIRNT